MAISKQYNTTKFGNHKHSLFNEFQRILNARLTPQLPGSGKNSRQLQPKANAELIRKHRRIATKVSRERNREHKRKPSLSVQSSRRQRYIPVYENYTLDSGTVLKRLFAGYHHEN
jgi:hypothetical protein